MRFNLLSGGRGLASAAAALLATDEKDAAQALGDLGAGRAEANDEDKGHVVVEPPAGDADDGASPNAAGGDDDTDEDKKKKDGEEDAAASAVDATAARIEGFAAGTERCLTVMRSEHFAGREGLAAELLASAMPADKIVAALGKAAKTGANPMLGNLASTTNPPLGAGKEAGGSKADAKASWDRTMAKLGFTKKD